MFTPIDGVSDAAAASAYAQAQAQASFMAMLDKDNTIQGLGNGTAPDPMSPQRQNIDRANIWDQSAQLGPGAHDLIGQLQNFDGSFNTVESNGTLDMLFANGALWDNVASDDWMTSVQNNTGVFASPTQASTNFKRPYE